MRLFYCFNKMVNGNKKIFSDSNRVNKIVDYSSNSTGFSETSTYGYDAAGRMISDSQKGKVAYNHLGLVKT